MELGVEGTQNLNTESVHMTVDTLVYEAHCVHCVHHLIEYLAVDRAHPIIPSYVHLRHLGGSEVTETYMRKLIINKTGGRSSDE